MDSVPLLLSPRAGDTMDANRVAFRKWSIIPRMLQDNTIRDLSVELFGSKYPSPVLVAPVGVNKIVSKVS